MLFLDKNGYPTPVCKACTEPIISIQMSQTWWWFPPPFQCCFLASPTPQASQCVWMCALCSLAYLLLIIMAKLHFSIMPASIKSQRLPAYPAIITPGLYTPSTLFYSFQLKKETWEGRDSIIELRFFVCGSWKTLTLPKSEKERA